MKKPFNIHDWQHKFATSMLDLTLEQEEEEELSRDVKILEKLLNDKINTKDEWVDMFQLLMAHSEEISGLSNSTIRSLLQQSMKEL